MSDRRDLLDRYAPLFPAPEQPYDGLLLRRDRKRRNNRIVAGVVGLAVGIAAVLVGTSLLSSGPTPTGPAPTTSSTAGPATPSATEPATPGSSPILRPGQTLVVGSKRITAVGGSPGTDRVLTTCRAPCIQFDTASVSADGRWLAYEIRTCFDKPPCDPEAGIWVIGPARGPRQVTDQCLSASECPVEIWAWSKQGSTLAVLGRGNSPELFTVDPATGDRTDIASAGSGAMMLAWSPDSSRIAYSTTTSLHSVDLATGVSSVLATDTGEIDDIEWSPDGSRMVYDTFQDGRNRVVAVDADGSNPVVLVDQGAPQGPAAPRWSPDGSRIAYVTTPGGFTGGGHGFSFAIWVVGADGSAPIRVFHGQCCIEDWRPPVWSPDGMRVAFWDDVDADSDLSTWLVVQADGSGSPQRIPESDVQGW